jgi:asparagine synthase (glutamine-hydrolysing)
MCGITGAVAFRDDRCITADLIDDMRDAMAHRGPDGARTWVEPGGRIGLGFRRLSIIDLSGAAMQPMSNEDGSIRVVFNGEIYNHAEIRRELERGGRHEWRSDHSDTEVIVHSFEEWGIACLERFRGMFALGIWDGRSRDLWLVRDRLGIKPLYYTTHDGRFSFASEIKALLRDPATPRAVDEEALFDYLSFLTTPAPTTLFAGIRKLPAGTWLHVAADGTTEERRWWDVWDHVTPLTGVPEAEIAERVLDELRTSVRLRKLSDVPVGVFLSGGIDSSTNAALFSEAPDEHVKTFSIGYDADYATYPSELPWARRMAKEVGADHHERILRQQDLVDFLPEMVRLQDEPIADPVCVPVYYVSKLARDNGVFVCQVGEGSDELFCGYPSWRRALRYQQTANLPVPRYAKQLGLAALRVTGRDSGTRYEWLRRNAAGQPLFWGGAEAFTQREKERLLGRRLRGRFRGRTSWQALAPVHDRFEASAWDRSSLNWMTYLDLNVRLPELLLMRVDKMSMGVGLEARVPFLDHKLVELVMSIPTEVKVRDAELKRVLKQAVRGVIPDQIIDRPKQGFGVPVEEWYTVGLGDRIRADVDPFLAASDLLDADAVHEVLDSGRAAQSWYLHNLALWWQTYIA